MKIITVNVNGIRSAATKGFFDWMAQQNADVICLQETRAESAKLAATITAPDGYHACFNDAERKGYSGVAIYSRQPPDRIRTELGWESADREGRFIQADFGALSVISIYLPSGTSGPERQAIKYEFMDRLLPALQRFRRQKRNYILCGDWNIAHKNIDIKNWRGNQKNSGFLPEERAWLDKVFDEVGLVDAFRVVNQEADQYTWWSNRGQAWAKNVGWRIDYQIISPRLRDRVRGAEIYTAQRFSDHAPLIMEYDLTL
jgi:exodeoxyribonuclease-3